MDTLFLATVIGWYLVIISLFFLLRREQFKLIMVDVVAQRGLFFVFAITTIILGLLMVVSHNVWVMGWPVIVTLFSWLVLISGLIRLFCPDAVKGMASSYASKPLKMQVTGVIGLLIGLFLLFKVYYPHMHI